ncbi:hypothetical protein [Solobacterium sp.]|uniref:hypothetical protein n=1 Tax=Solobacterium sp. TaxID=2060878 RepID=UPI001CB121FA|nr:hypothetical protein [Solobacterium sp.]MBF1099856.1 hypothetical protein [Solobacterium sp.]
MKRIDVVELYVFKRIEKLEQENGSYKLHEKEIAELKDVLDVIHHVNHAKQKQDANKIDAFVYSLSKLNELLADAEED